MSRPRSRTRKEFPQTSRGSSLLASSLRMEEPYLTTTSRRRALFILCSDSEEETKFCGSPGIYEFWLYYLDWSLHILNSKLNQLKIKV